MEKVIARIKAYQKVMGYNFKTMSLEERMQMFRNYVFALVVEQGELAQELPTKPWRKLEDQFHADTDTLAEEWVDSLFFLVNQALALGLNEKLLRKAFEAKLNKNYQRIKEGYNG